MDWLLANFILGVTYSSGAYGNNVYSAASLVQIGPLTLPNTGAGWMVLVSAGLLAVSAGWMVWLWQRRRAHNKAAQ